MVGGFPSGPARCFGLLNSSGYGPLVIVPPFTSTIEITFLAKGVFVRADDRDRAGGRERVPVALVTAERAGVADLLNGLAAPSLLGADTIWDHSAADLVPNAPTAEDPLEILYHKFDQPAEAVAAAHYLLRFLPRRLPLSWAKNLKAAIPTAADGPMLAAWALVSNRPSGMSDAEVDAAFAGHVSDALARPVTLFARTRALLFSSQKLLSGDLRSDTRWAAAEAFRRAGAGAGALEAYWGHSPALAGASGPNDPGPPLLNLFLNKDQFE